MLFGTEKNGSSLIAGKAAQAAAPAVGGAVVGPLGAVAGKATWVLRLLVCGVLGGLRVS